QQHVNEFMDEHGLHMAFAAAVLAQEFQVYLQHRRFAQRDREGFDLFGELDATDAEYATASERAFVDKIAQDVAKIFFVNLHKTSVTGKVGDGGSAVDWSRPPGGRGRRRPSCTSRAPERRRAPRRPRR